jgi:hypothetical protein
MARDWDFVVEGWYQETSSTIRDSLGDQFVDERIVTKYCVRSAVA